MTKQDYKLMLKDGLFWFVLVLHIFLCLCFIAVVPLAVIVALLLGMLAVTFLLMSVVAYKMYKQNKYWHYKKED